MLANGIALNTGGYRFYCFSNQPIDRNIRSIYSTTGQTWMLESGYRLLYDSTTWQADQRSVFTLSRAAKHQYF